MDEHQVLELSFQTLLTTTTLASWLDCLLRPKLVEVDPAPIGIAPLLHSISSSPVEGKVIQSTVLTNSHGVATATGVH